MAYHMLGSVRSGFIAAVGTQVVLTLASIGHHHATGYDGFGATPSQSCRDLTEAFDAPHYGLVTEFVTKLYSGNGTSHPHVQLSDGVTFEDPAASCVGVDEFEDAFRALSSLLDPRPVIPPYCVDVRPQGESIDLIYALHQQYSIGEGGRGGKHHHHGRPGGWMFRLPSLLIVTVQLRPMKGVPESEFVICRMEERWNGIALWNSYLFRIVRRINGRVSYQLTQRFLR